jgi:hypothetical protein
VVAVANSAIEIKGARTVPTSNPVITLPKFTAGGQDVALTFTSPDSSVVAAIDDNTPFPAGDITIGNLTANVNTGTPLEIGDSTSGISFSFTAGTSYGLVIITAPADVLKQLNANSNIAAGIDLTTGTRFLVLSLTYNL